MSVAELVAAACVALSGSHITAGDLAKALPGFVPVDPAAVVAWSPLPGAVRIFHAAELRRLLATLDTSVSVPGAGICFEFKLAPLAEAAVAEAMHRVLPADSTIDIVEFSHVPAPAGEVVFVPESLASPVSPEAPALWRGFVRYGDNAKFQIWARVKVRVPVTRLVAVEVLRQGAPIRASQVKLAMLYDFPSIRVTPTSEAIAVGYIPRRNIPANSPVWADALDPPMEIVKGDRVAVTVRSGLAVLSLNVEAMTSGRTGDAISLKNPSSGKLFRARIDGPNAASVQVDPVNP